MDMDLSHLAGLSNAPRRARGRALSVMTTRANADPLVRWVNDVIALRGVEVNIFPLDFKNGVIVCHLAEVLTKRSLGGFNRSPKMTAHKIDNIASAFNLLGEDPALKLVNIGPEDVHAG